jgi:hypothetical protein
VALVTVVTARRHVVAGMLAGDRGCGLLEVLGSVVRLLVVMSVVIHPTLMSCSRESGATDEGRLAKRDPRDGVYYVHGHRDCRNVHGYPSTVMFAFMPPP